jgi:glycosyltransferase involved in cell wall biosynthesis
MIGLITTSYPRTPDDWAGAFVRERVRRLAVADEVEVIAAGDDRGERDALSGREIRIPGSLFYGAGAPEALEAGGAAALIAGVGFAARLARAVAERAGRWDAVESHWLVPCALVACAVAPRLRHRAFSHGGDVALLERLPLGASLARFIAGSGADMVFASGDLRSRFARLCGVAAADLPAAVEPAPFDGALFRRRSEEDRVQARRRLGCDRPTLVGVGRLVPVKGFDVLVRAVARLPAAHRPRLVLLGDGPERPALLDRAARGRVDLQLPGAVGRSTVADWLAAADLYVQPSVPLPNGRAEGMPVAVREALAVGLPVIATAVGGMTELSDPSLTLIAPGDPGALARAIATFL